MHQINKKSRMFETYSLLFIDLATIILSYFMAFFMRFKTFDTAATGTGRALVFNVCLYFMLFCLLYSMLMEWNRGFFNRGLYVEAKAVLKYVFSMTIAVGFLLYLTKGAGDFSRLFFGYFGVVNATLTWLSHVFFKAAMMNYYKNSNSSAKVMVVTDSEYISDLMVKLKKDKAWNYEITSIAIMDSDLTGEEFEGVPVVASKNNLYEVARMSTLDEVFLFLPNTMTKDIKQMIIDFETMGVVCHYSVDALEFDMKGKTVGNFAGYAVISFSLQQFDYRRMLIKRVIDILGGAFGLLITGMITPFVALAIKLESKGPVFFSQVRIGKNGRRFKIYKFRSMYQDAEARKKELMAQNEMQDGLMFKMEKDPRITKVGAFIRKTSIDELPQFWNVFVGDMSLVGTRPPTEDEFEQYKIEYRRRMSITPGLTGMWQVKGRGKVFDFDEVVKLDLEYIDNWSLGMDIKILFQTVYVVLFGVGSK